MLKYLSAQNGSNNRVAPAVSIYKTGWGAEPTGGPPSTGPPDVSVKIP